MKTINKTIALLFAAAAFTTCTKPTLEPVKPATQPQVIISRPDTLVSSGYPDQDTHEPVDFEHKKRMPFNDELRPGTHTPKPVVVPATQPQTGPAAPVNPGRPVKLISGSDSLINQ